MDGSLACVLPGLAIGAHTWWPMPTVAEMTPGEFNFVLTSDAFLDHFHRPEERHVAMECLSVLGMIHQAQPEVRASKREAGRG